MRMNSDKRMEGYSNINGVVNAYQYTNCQSFATNAIPLGNAVVTVQLTSATTIEFTWYKVPKYQTPDPDTTCGTRLEVPAGMEWKFASRWMSSWSSEQLSVTGITYLPKSSGA